MGAGTTFIVIFLALLYLSLTAIDLGLNILQVIPFVGTGLETLSEAIIEGLQAIMVMVGAVVIAKWGNEVS